MISSSGLGDNVSTLLEEGIYAEETKGDLDEAIAIYQKIIDENAGNSANIAEAYYRLGTCYLKTGDDARAIEMFNELLTGFREREEIASEARAQLVKLNALDEEDQMNKPLELGPAPWEAGETSWYSYKAATGVELGKRITTIKEAVINGNDVWRIEHYLGIPIQATQLFTRVDVFKEDFTPVSGSLKGSMSTIGYNNKAIYEKDHIQFDIESQGVKNKKEIPISNIVYDHDQLNMLLRRLPIKDNYSVSFSVFMLQSGKVSKVQLRTMGQETITVSAGTFNCYYVELEIDSTLKYKYWISADDRKYGVKGESQIILELDKVAQVTTEETEKFSDSEFGISMFAPKGWHFIKSPITGTYKMLLQILSPEIKASAMFIYVPHGGAIKSLEDVVKADADIIEKAFINGLVRSDSWKSENITGLSSLAFTADYDDNGKKMVENRVYILGPSDVYWFVFRTEKELFEKFIPNFNSIAKSFKKE
jgi:hypothetical protein